MADESMKLYILVGLPGSGKSTWVKSMAPTRSGCIVINRDAMRTMVNGGSYEYDPRKEKIIKEGSARLMCAAILSETGMSDVIIDDTNTTKKRRAYWIGLVKERKGRPWYRKVRIIAVKMKTTDPRTCLMQRMKEPKGQSEEVWAKVIAQMNVEYEAPEMDEGFDEIIEA